MYTKAFLIKLIMTTAVLWIVLGVFYSVPTTNILIASVLLTVIGFLGDIFVLPKIGNVWSAIGDFFLALVVVWILASNIFNATHTLATASFVSALLLMMGELFLHRYMESHIFQSQIKNPEEKIGYYQRTDLLTEFAEEVDIDKDLREEREEKK